MERIIIAILILLFVILVSIDSNIENFEGKDPIVLKGKEGPRGPSGPPGPIGPAGGTYQDKGFLVNHQYLENPINIQPGIGKSTLMYRQINKNKVPYPWNQYTHHSDGRIEADQGGCLWGDAGSGNIYIDKCDKANPSNQWTRNKQLGQLQWAQDPKKCISLDTKTRNIPNKNIYNPDGTKKALSDTTNLEVLNLTNCTNSWNNPNSPSQQFYFF